MKYQITKTFTNRSHSIIVESHKPLIPTIIFFRDSSEDSGLITLKFCWWKWWWQLGVFYKKR